MQYRYPVNLDPQEDGSILVSFPDVPEALTDGDDHADAMAQAQDCLVAALVGYVSGHRNIPAPTRPRRGQEVVALPPLIAAKLALYQAMRDQRVTRVALAERLGVTENVVRRLLDLRHRSHIGQVESALATLGKQLVVQVDDAA